MWRPGQDQGVRFLALLCTAAARFFKPLGYSSATASSMCASKSRDAAVLDLARARSCTCTGRGWLWSLSPRALQTPTGDASSARAGTQQPKYRYRRPPRAPWSTKGAFSSKVALRYTAASIRATEYAVSTHSVPPQYLYLTTFRAGANHGSSQLFQDPAPRAGRPGTVQEPSTSRANRTEALLSTSQQHHRLQSTARSGQHRNQPDETKKGTCICGHQPAQDQVTPLWAGSPVSLRSRLCTLSLNRAPQSLLRSPLRHAIIASASPGKDKQDKDKTTQDKTKNNKPALSRGFADYAPFSLVPPFSIRI
ncbi:hypothetical protein M440DRAFT_1443493 [Trichoderma longibrachiatum ATCC 18648]|uniref:Uncharacterized protein n=1 Tax=Trichoderma longibrachiatum ATCC 18648 TaxID=983965 RepID=A0A2T4CI19_TRILO|nr:hypothetical protein M440DRAFT_1443493 [Trichoderma longibrachiatum ATCC 18648]